MYYIRGLCKQQTILYKSFLKYGVDKHKFEIQEECEFSELNNRERYWQDEFNCISKLGLNCYLEQGNGMPRVASDETRAKLSDSQSGSKNSMYGRTGDKHPNYGRLGKDNPLFGRTVTKETGDKISKALKGRKLSEEHVQKIRDFMKDKYKGENNPMYGKPMPLETVIKMIKTKTGKDVTEEQILERRLKESQRKRVVKDVITKNIKTGDIYHSLKEASEVTGISTKNLSRKLNGSRKNDTVLIRLN